MSTAQNPANAGRLIRTYSGRYIDLWDPKPGDFNIEDIAHHLSLMCRYNGAIKHHYSVAEHSVWCAYYVWEQCPSQALAALLHDASEAYIADILRPIKHQHEMSGYLQIEDMVMKGIVKEFGFQYPFDPIVKEADNAALDYEWKNYITDAEPLVGLRAEYAENSFLFAYKVITNPGLLIP